MTDAQASMVLRLAGPLQSWGVRSQFNRRDTAPEPTKSGIIGLLAAAQGRARTAGIDDLVGLEIGVRTDQPGSLLRDYHTVSDYRGVPLPSAKVNKKGIQARTSPMKMTHVTTRFYLQDAVFVVAVRGDAASLAPLAAAIRRPLFPLALGRRSCVPTLPLLLAPPAELAAPDSTRLWGGCPRDVLACVPRQGAAARGVTGGRSAKPLARRLLLTVDDPGGDDIAMDVPRSFAPRERGFAGRRVTRTWVTPSCEGEEVAENIDEHDPFALLGW
jgi:CRISPR system Cascade subunit CasD